ncbi:MAG TPA: PQQ-binding-like beta-propeller repeat protein [Pirellulales bacterium]|nr:PQQ-binding-like beta-propeller repeat protein [Pirellulales bacterium]
MRALYAALWAALCIAGASAGRADDWPHWRGPHRNDIVAEGSLWKDGRWVVDKPLWKTAVGEGSTSPLVIAGRLYVMGWQGDEDHVWCLDAIHGKPAWSVSYACPQFGRYAVGDQNAYAGPTSTPEFDAQTRYLYTLSCDGHLNCWDTANQGRRVWGMNLYDRFGAGQRPASKLERDDLRDYGYTTSPCVHDDWLLVEVGAKDGGLMAFDKRTGELRWKSEYRGPAGHTGGLAPITVEDVPCVAFLALDHLAVARLDAGHEGKTVATYPWRSAWANNVLTPAVQGDCLLIGSWHTHRSICKLKISLRGAERLWEQPHASHVGTPLIEGKYVYLAGERLFCLDWKTGRLVWEGGSYGNGGACIATGDNKLIVWSDRGQASLIASAEAAPDKYQPLARLAHLFGDASVWPHPVIADQRLYFKDRHGNLKCFQ